MTAVTRAPRRGLASRVGATPVGSQRSTWRNRDVAFTPVLSSTMEPTLSSQGPQFQDVVSAFSTVHRYTFSEVAPGIVPSWKNSAYYPDLPLSNSSSGSPGFQLLGATSITTSGFGVLDTYNAVKNGAEAYRIGDTRGIGYSMLEGTLGVTELAYGPVVGTYRVSSIGSLLKAGDSVASAPWTKVANESGMGLMGLLTVIYGAVAAIETGKAWDSYSFQKKVDKRHDPKEKLAYLKKRLQADEATLLAKEKKKLIKQDHNLTFWTKRLDKLAKANIEAQGKALAIQEQTGQLKEQIALMKKLKIGNQGFTLTQNQLESVVKKRFSDKGLSAHGKQLLIRNLQQKKIAKMTRLVGDKAVQLITQAKRPNPITLAEIEHASSDMNGRYRKRAALYITGTVLTALSIVFTGGMAAIVLSIGLGLVYGVELYWSYKRMEALRKDDSSPPGARDKIIPLASLALNFAIGTTIAILAAFYPISLSALVLTGIGLLLWAGLNCRQLQYVDERKKRYVERLFHKPHLEIQEFSYVVTHGTAEQSMECMRKLSKKDQKALQERIRLQKREDTLKGLSVMRVESLPQQQQRFVQACTDWIFELQKLALQPLARELELEFGAQVVRV